VSRRREHSANQPGAPDLPRGPGPHTLSGPLSGKGTDTPTGGPDPPRVRRRRHARGHQASSGRLAHLPHSMRGTLSALCRARGDFCQAVLLIARYQGTQYSRWRHPRHARQSATPVRHDSSTTEYHNAYAVDLTVYAATYTASTGASSMGQVKTPRRSRDYSAKHIREEILNHCSTIYVFFCSTLYILVGPTCRGPTPVYASSLCYKRGDAR